MSQSIPAGLLAHLEGETQQMASCLRITLNNGSVLRFTEHDRSLTVGAETFKAANGYLPSTVSLSAGLNVDNGEFNTFIDDADIKEAEVAGGLWDGALIERFLVCWNDPGLGIIKLASIELGEFRLDDAGALVAEIRSLKQHLQNTIGVLIEPNCSARLGDTRCKVNLASFTHAGDVTAVSDRTHFASGLAQPDGYFSNGELHWTAGANAGLSIEVKTYTVGAFILALPMPYPLAAGDTFNAIKGCAKTKAACIGFANIANHRAFPYVPGARAAFIGGSAGL